jgi:hypothetical protein
MKRAQEATLHQSRNWGSSYSHLDMTQSRKDSPQETPTLIREAPDAALKTTEEESSRKSIIASTSTTSSIDPTTIQEDRIEPAEGFTEIALSQQRVIPANRSSLRACKSFQEFAFQVRFLSNIQLLFGICMSIMATTRIGKKKEGSAPNTNSDSNQNPTQEPPHAVSQGSHSKSPGNKSKPTNPTPNPTTTIAQESSTVSPDSQSPAKHKANHDTQLTSWFTQTPTQLYFTLFTALQSYFGPSPKYKLEGDDP